MCGLTGFLSPDGVSADRALAVARRMADTIAHRGPDDAGEWVDADAGIVLAHRRLSIVDLSAAGRQPMVSVTGRFVLAFNGEIYNHPDLRRKLETVSQQPHAWRGHSDTETLLACIEQWGLERALQMSVGMFALALWDRHERALSLARDRAGEKPLYYGWQGNTFLFGSELKALRAHPAFASQVDRDVLHAYLQRGYVPSPWSIWKGIRKLPPGTTMRLRAGPHVRDAALPVPFWSLAQAIEKGRADPFAGTDKDAADALESHIRQAVSGQMVADVPLGAFLSGGIDSSTIVALMQSQSGRPVRTFTIGFSQAAYNEAEHAKAVAAHLGTEHTELYVTPEQTRSVIPDLPAIYDEPFGDPSAIPTCLVSRLARQRVTVSLSGDGGDELLGGYGRYLNRGPRTIWRMAQSAGHPLRRMAVKALQTRAPAMADDLLRALPQVAGSHGRLLRARADLLARVIDAPSPDVFYRTMLSHWHEPPVAGASTSAEGSAPMADLGTASLPMIEHMMAVDTLSFLPDQILVKVDRAAMAVSLETRVPLLDHRVIEFAWRLPYRFKVRHGQGKWLLRQVLERHVPREITDRPKMGFGVPLDAWLRGPLREWAEDLLSVESLRAGGFFAVAPIRERWQQHLQARHDWQDSLWVVLMFQAWHRSLTSSPAPSRLPEFQ